ncbi:MAG: beta-ketoacyl synthase N-terminal-like domain-containing protein [Methylococcus sp.]
MQVLLTGMGVIAANGRDIPEFEKSLKEGISGIRYCERMPGPPITPAIGAELRPFDLRERVGQYAEPDSPTYRQSLELGLRAPLPVQAAIVASVEAWWRAGLHEVSPHPERIGLVIAGHNTTTRLQWERHEFFQQNPDYLSPRHALRQLDTDHLGTLSQIFDLRGEGYVTGGASASGNIGLIQAVRLLRADVVDACLVCGILADPSPMEWQAFLNLGAMGGQTGEILPAEACRPFDQAHAGFIFGQGSATVVLESSDSARRRGRAGLLELRGGSVILHGSAGSDPSREGEARAMAAALAQSGLRPQEIGYVNSHGTSTPLGDAVELAALKDVFGDAFYQPWINSTKALTGHCLHAAGVVELIATALQVQGGFLHGNPNLVNPIDPAARFCGRSLQRIQVGAALSNSFGFGGINTSLVVSLPGPGS